MSNEKYLEELKQMKNKPGFKHVDQAIETSKGKLSISLHGPDDFVTKMPKLIEKLAKSSYNKKMMGIIANSQKPLSVIHTNDRKLLAAGRLYKPKSWYKFLSASEVSQLILLFNLKGYPEPIHYEARYGSKVKRFSQFDEIKYTLAHEFFHMWIYLEPRKYPKLGGRITYSMHTPPKLQDECWATRYTNGWRYQEKKYIRYIYRHQGFNHNVDSIKNYK